MPENDVSQPKLPLIQRIELALCRPKAKFVLLIVTLVFFLVFSGLFGTFYVAVERNDLLLHEDGKALRQNIITTGDQPALDSYYVEQISMRSVDLKEKKVNLLDQEYRVLATTEDISADWININATFLQGDYIIRVALESCFCIDMEYPQPYGITITSSIFYDNTPEDWQQGTVQFFYDKLGRAHDGLVYASSCDFDHLEFPLKAMIGSCYDAFTPEFVSQIQAILHPYYRQVFAAMPEVLGALGVTDARAFWEHKVAEKQTIVTLARTGELYIVAGTLCSLSLCLLLFVLLRHTIEKSKAKHHPVLASPLPEEVPPQKEVQPNRALEVIRKSKIKPCIGEWVLRSIGLLLILSFSVYIGISRICAARGWEMGLGEFGQNLFQSFYAAGHLTLIVVVAVIIAETRRNLAHFAALFFSLGFGYFVMMTGMLYAIERLFAGENAKLLTYILRFELPGNLFFGVGIFTFLGFFLFAKPEEAFIKEKTMRLLSLLPVAMAIGSIVMSALMQHSDVDVPLFLSNLFFVKDPTFLIAGIGLEYVIFGIRRYCGKHYGASAREVERSKEMQILKNLALCGMVLLLCLLTYAIPVNARMGFGLSCKYSIGFLLIPLFLFMKPSGEDRNHRFDWLYYLLFLVTSALPTIIAYAGQVFNHG